MEKQILNFTVNEQILVCENPIKISTNKVNYIQAHFDLGTNWSGYDSIRAIWYNDFNCVSTVLDSLGNCVVPFEVMKRKGNVKVNLVGSISENDVLTDRLTSYPIVAVIVDCTAQINGAETAPITPSQFEQYVAIVRGLVDSVKDIDHIELNSDYTLTIYYSDGTSDTTGSVRGADGNGIESVTKTSASGLVDTYTITYTDGQTTTFTVTNGAKGDTGNGIQSIAKTSTVGLVDTYTITYTNGTTTTFTVTNGEKGDKGDTGEVSLSELEDATIVQTLSDSEPYNYRRTNNGNGAGVREYDEIVGASVAWNQLVSNVNASGEVYGITRSDASSGDVKALKYSGTCTNSINFSTVAGMPYISGHKYFLTLGVESLPSGMGIRGQGVAVVDRAVSGITNNFNGSFGLYITSGLTVDLTTYPMLIDLTLALGSTIADYVYTLEQSTAGSGVTWLKTHFPKLFDNGYQPFDSGSIKSVSGLTAHEMVGRNLWGGLQMAEDIHDAVPSSTLDTTAKTIKFEASAVNGKVLYSRLFPNTQYTIILHGDNTSSTKATNMLVKYTDGTYTYLPNFVNGISLFTTDSAKSVLSIQGNWGTSQTTLYYEQCGVFEGSLTADQFEPYESYTYTLDSSVTLRGQYKLDANNQLYADGDVYKASGQIGRTWGEVGLGSLAWTNVGVSGKHVYLASVSGKGAGRDTMVCSKYPLALAGYDEMPDKTITSRYSSPIEHIYIRDESYTSASALKTSLDGVKLVFNLATEVTETATPYTSPQWCDSKGTEEYVGSELPVGHNTDYPMTMVDCADGLGDGTYEAKLTIANGVKTFTWQSV